jgi:hypothetical protein
MNRLTALLATVLFTVALAGTASTAVANVAIGTPGLLVRFTGRPTLTAGSQSTTCTVVLGIQLNRSIRKSAGSVIGTVLASPASSISACSAPASAGTVLAGMTLRYVSFSGTLPNGITAIRAVASPALFSLNTSVGTCLYTGTVNVNIPVSGMNVNSATISATGLTTSGPGILCSSFLNNASITNGGLSANLTIPLTLLN